MNTAPSFSSKRGDDKIFLTTDEVVLRWGGKVKKKTLQNWRALGQGPKFRRFGNKVDYRLDHIKKWESEEMNRVFKSTGEWRRHGRDKLKEAA